MTCQKGARLSLAAVSGHASGPDRLELESHLAECASCREQHTALGAVVGQLQGWSPAELAPAARDRVRGEMLRAAGKPRAARHPGPPPRRRLVTAAGLLAVGAAAAGLALSGRMRGPAEPAPLALSASQTFRAEPGGHARAGHALVTFESAAEVRWQESARTLELVRGALTIEVTPGTGREFRVSTARFTVEVVGTRFSVTEDEVRTFHGKVRVLDRAGGAIALLGAGQRWRAPPAPPALIPTAPRSAARPSSPPPGITASPPPSAESSASAIAPPAPPIGTAMAPTRPESGDTAPAAGRERVLPPRSPTAALARARGALAAGRADQARVLLEDLVRGPRGVAVEARVLLAESYLVEGRYQDAMTGYGVVARDFAGTSQAESALFMLAQLELEHGSARAAEERFRRYLARYPSGRFAREARAHLEAERGSGAR